MSQPDEAVRTHLINAGVCTVGKVFIGPIREDDVLPSDSVFILTTSGFKQPHAYMSTSRDSFRPMRLNIYVRGPQGDFITTRNKAEAIWLELQAQDVTGFLGALNNQSAAQYQGKDRQQRDLFLIYLDIFIKE